MFKFPLYVAGDAQNCADGIAKLSALHLVHPPDRHEIEVVDVCREPKRALADGILMRPTFVKLRPSLPGSIVGTLGRTQPGWPALKLEI
jgi:circadian clock protein KaiB